MSGPLEIGSRILEQIVKIKTTPTCMGKELPPPITKIRVKVLEFILGDGKGCMQYTVSSLKYLPE